MEPDTTPNLFPDDINTTRRILDTAFVFLWRISHKNLTGCFFFPCFVQKYKSNVCVVKEPDYTPLQIASQSFIAIPPCTNAI